MISEGGEDVSLFLSLSTVYGPDPVVIPDARNKI